MRARGGSASGAPAGGDSVAGGAADASGTPGAGVWARAGVGARASRPAISMDARRSERSRAIRRVWRGRPLGFKTDRGSSFRSSGAGGHQAERARVLGARALLVVLGGVALPEQVVHLVVSPLHAVEALERHPRAARVAAPGHELAGALERLRVVRLHVEQRPVGSQRGLVVRGGEAAAADLAQHLRIAWAGPYEALPLAQRGLARSASVVELGQRDSRPHRLVPLAQAPPERGLVLGDGVLAPAELGQEPARLH